MTHLSDDETVAKMGHPIVVVRSDVGHPSGLWQDFDRARKDGKKP